MMLMNEPIYVEEIHAPASEFLSVRKKVWRAEQQQFVDVTFVRITCKAAESAQIENVLQRAYGPPRFQGHWWRQITGTRTSYIWMDEQAATYYSLAKNPGADSAE